MFALLAAPATPGRDTGKGREHESSRDQLSLTTSLSLPHRQGLFQNLGILSWFCPDGNRQHHGGRVRWVLFFLENPIPDLGSSYLSSVS